jgi:hypothetical protein
MKMGFKILNFANCKSSKTYLYFCSLRKTAITFLFVLGCLHSHATSSPLQDTISPGKGRIWLVAGAHAAIWTGSFIALNEAWYADYPKQEFHLFNDWPEWQQMDKAGHVWTTYQLSRLSADVWKWSGVSDKTSVWLGGASGLAFQSVIEILDGFSEEWGFSLYDMGANVVGAGLFVSQALIWKEQRIAVKFSYFPYAYPPELQARSEELFGAGPAERILKDYNSQTYWLSANLRDFLPRSRLPKWLSISAGYNARLMVGGRENVWTDESGTVQDYSSIPRYRRFFLSLDVDLTRIRTKSPLLRTVFSALNAIKIPAPALEYNTRGQWIFHPFYF